MTDHDRPTILLLTSGYHLYREYLLAGVARAADVWLLGPAEPTWERPYIVGHTVVEDSYDCAAVVAAGKALADRIRIDGALCWDEVRMVTLAELAAVLGVPAPTPGAAAACRDKHLTRAALARAGVPQPISVKVSTLEEARAAAGTIGYPVVLKPRALGASFGVVLVEEPGGMAEGFAEARGAGEDGVPYYEDGVLVESYLDGPEISVDCVCTADEVQPLFLARKQLGFPPYFEEVGHVVDTDDSLLSDPALLGLLRDAHDALGFRNGITHVELRLTRSGPKVIEINGRLGGDLIPYVGMLASGRDPGRIAVDVATGRAPDLAPTRRRVGAIRFYYPPTNGTVQAVTVLDGGKGGRAGAAGALVDVAPLAEPGRAVVLPPEGRVVSRYAYATAVADDAETCQRALDEVEGRVLVLELAVDGALRPAG